MPEYPILLTLQQVAKRSGKSEKTLRRWIKDGKLVTLVCTAQSSFHHLSRVFVNGAGLAITFYAQFCRLSLPSSIE